MLSRYQDPTLKIGKTPLPRFGGATFALQHRLARLLWLVTWLVLAAWTPPPFGPWRRLVLMAFGARIHPTASVRGSARIWWPANLTMGKYASMGPGVICYNPAPIKIDDFAIV